MFDTLTPTTTAGTILTDCPAPTSPRSTPSKFLVIAPDSEPGGEPRVFLADSESQTENERLFNCANDIVRMPRSAPVAIRPVRYPDRPLGGPAAERALLDAVTTACRRTRAAASALSLPSPVQRHVPAQRGGLQAVEPVNGSPGNGELTRRFRAALQCGDGPAAHACALLVQQDVGLGVVYELLRRTLDDVGQAWADGKVTILAEHAVTSAATTVVELLRAHAPLPRQVPGFVVLTSPADDRHVLALPVLAHLLEQAGHRVRVAADLPRGELLSLAARPDTVAVVVSVHHAVQAAMVHSLVADLRRANATMKIAVGGPGLPHSAAFGRSCEADLVSNDPSQLLKLLVEGEATPLTPRESEVLRAVADGLTNSEIAALLRIAATTVKSHLDSVLSKTGTDHRAAAVARALRAGWIS